MTPDTIKAIALVIGAFAFITPFVIRALICRPYTPPVPLERWNLALKGRKS